MGDIGICVQTFVLTSPTFSLLNVLPEAICCCLQTCYVDVKLLLMDCMCIPTFIVVTLLVVLLYTEIALYYMYGLRCFSY